MRPAMFAGFMGLLINIPCNYILIFGKLGLRRSAGRVRASPRRFVYWVMFLTMVGVRVPAYLLAGIDDLAGMGISPFGRPLKKLAGIGFPGALAMLFEVTLFAAVALLIAPLSGHSGGGTSGRPGFSVSLLFMVRCPSVLRRPSARGLPRAQVGGGRPRGEPIFVAFWPAWRRVSRRW